MLKRAVDFVDIFYTGDREVYNQARSFSYLNFYYFINYYFILMH